MEACKPDFIVPNMARWVFYQVSVTLSDLRPPSSVSMRLISGGIEITLTTD